jgi:hypothetical protein
MDPEGDFEGFPEAICVGDEQHPPTFEQAVQLVEGFENTVVNLLGVPLADRPEAFAGAMGLLHEVRIRTGRPHWMVVDEAHHLLPVSWRPAVPQMLDSAILITVHPDHVSPAVLMGVDTVLAVGTTPIQTLESFCTAVGEALPELPSNLQLEKGEVLFWPRRQGKQPFAVRVEPSTADRRRHRRKYALGDIQEKSFYFRGPDGKLNLRAQNLSLFVQIAEGVDDETWLHHLRQGDYSRWVRSAIKDDKLAEEIAAIEREKIPPAESRARVKDSIERQYTGAA